MPEAALHSVDASRFEFLLLCSGTVFAYRHFGLTFEEALEGVEENEPVSRLRIEKGGRGSRLDARNDLDEPRRTADTGMHALITYIYMRKEVDRTDRISQSRSTSLASSSSSLSAVSLSRHLSAAEVYC